MIHDEREPALVASTAMRAPHIYSVERSMPFATEFLWSMLAAGASLGAKIVSARADPEQVIVEYDRDVPQADIIRVLNVGIESEGS